MRVVGALREVEVWRGCGRRLISVRREQLEEVLGLFQLCFE